MFIFLLAPGFAWLWTFLSKHNMEPGTPMKFGLGILQAGLGFGALVLGATMPDASGKVAYIWIVLAYLLHTTGELMFISCRTFSSNKTIGSKSCWVYDGGLVFSHCLFGVGSSTDWESLRLWILQEAKVADVGAAGAVYADFFSSLMWVGVAISVAYYLYLTPLMKKGMHGVK